MPMPMVVEELSWLSAILDQEKWLLIAVEIIYKYIKTYIFNSFDDSKNKWKSKAKI